MVVVIFCAAAGGIASSTGGTAVNIASSTGGTATSIASNTGGTATSIASSTGSTATSIASSTSVISWSNGIERHYEGGRLHREGGPAVAIKGVYEAWYQRGDPHRIGADVFERVAARSQPADRAKITKSRCPRVPLDVYQSNTQRWSAAGGIEMLDSFVFTIEPKLVKGSAEAQIWYCAGEVWGAASGYSVRSANARYARGLWYTMGISPADSLCCRLTDLCLDWMDASVPMCIVHCMACNAVVKIKTPQLANVAGGTLCALCTPHA